jgi:hypothetical protein
MSSYRGLDLFGSGPHRFYFGRQGYLLTLDFFGGGSGGGSTAQGLLDLDIFVRGRLVATGEPSLWILRNAIRAELTVSPPVGTLIDNAGRPWANMSLVQYSERGRRDIGRVYSIRYEALFRKL